MKPLSIFIGYDPREHAAYEVACRSISRRTSVPVLITPLYLPHLQRYFKRPVERRREQLWCPVSNAPMSTEFAISRFCVPFIQTEGWALYADCDVLCLADIVDLFAMADDRYAVMVVKRDYQPTSIVKMDNQVQTSYARKLWSSVIFWNTSHPAHLRLTRERIEKWPGRDLHAFRWLGDEEIGELPQEWNHLVDINQGEGKLLHYTLGGAWLSDWRRRPSDELWLAEQAADVYELAK